MYWKRTVYIISKKTSAGNIKPKCQGSKNQLTGKSDRFLR
jgi:hypothetical protein